MYLKKIKLSYHIFFSLTIAFTLASSMCYAQSLSNIKNEIKEEVEVKEIKSYVHAHGMPFKGKILMVASSPATSKQTGWSIGFWAAELTHPLHVFQEACYDVELASTEGGKIVMDTYSNPTNESGYAAHDVITLGYMQLNWFNKMLENTKKLTEVNTSEYDAIFLVGGQGPMYTFKDNDNLEKLFTNFYETGKPSAAVCHSVSLLLEAKKSDGKLIVDGKTWTGFSNAEEEYVDKSVGQKVQPYWIEEEARKLPNTNFKVATPFSSYAIEDGNLITGQQQNSGAATAKFVVNAFLLMPNILSFLATTIGFLCFQEQGQLQNMMSKRRTYLQAHT